MEAIFFKWITGSVRNAKEPVTMVYQSAVTGKQQQTVHSRNYGAREEGTDTLQVHVTSPSFYTRFMHYSHALEAFEREGFAADVLDRTVVISNAHNLPKLFPRLSKGEQETPNFADLSFLDRVRWDLLANLRRPPPNQTRRLEDSAQGAQDPEDIRALPLSPVDRFMICETTGSVIYRRTLTQQFLATRFALGSSILVDLTDLILRAVAIYLGLWLFLDYVVPTAETRINNTRIIKLLLGGLQMQAVHAWSFTKGL